MLPGLGKIRSAGPFRAVSAAIAWCVAAPACGGVAESGSAGTGTAGAAGIANDGGPDATTDVDAADDGGCTDGLVLCGATCVDTSSAVQHCGDCSTDCSSLAHTAAATCVSGSCAVGQCAGGYADCDGNAANGCEANLADGSTCGDCATKCSEPTPVCAPAGASWACASGCGGAAPDRCDTSCVDTATDVAHCGSCDTACMAPADATPSCSAGACAWSCNAGYHDCGGTCADDSSPTACGAACVTCTAPANASATCVAGACGVACDAGFLLMSGACVVPPAPRLIAPLSTSRVTSRRPTLRWELPAGIDNVTLDLCLDRACTQAVGAPVQVTGSSYKLPDDLPAGVVFWRVHPATVTSVSSATWEMNVGVHSAPLDTSWGTTLDVNGDGFADLAVGAADAYVFSGGPQGVYVTTGRAYVFSGGTAGPSLSPVTTLTGPDGNQGRFGTSVASAGDVNGDGFADLVVGAPGASGGDGRVYVYLGSASGLTTPAATTLSYPFSVHGQFGTSVASAGDVDGDGYADVIVGAPALLGGTAQVFVYRGGPGGLADVPATSLIDPAGANTAFGFSVAGAGDIDGDGFADVAIGAYGEKSGTGRIYVFRGTASGLDATPMAFVDGRDGVSGQFGYSVAGVGDMNGDGHADLVVGAPGVATQSGRAYIYFGYATWISSLPTTVLLAPDGIGGNFGRDVAGAGDLDGDGYADVVVGAWEVANQTGRAYAYRGGPLAPSGIPDVTLAAPDSGTTEFGLAVASAGDVDRDGIADLVVGAPWAKKDGRAYVFAGVSGSGPPASPAWTVVAPDPNAGFGSAAFGATN